MCKIKPKFNDSWKKYHYSSTLFLLWSGLSFQFFILFDNNILVCCSPFLWGEVGDADSQWRKSRQSVERRIIYWTGFAVNADRLHIIFIFHAAASNLYQYCDAQLPIKRKPDRLFLNMNGIIKLTAMRGWSFAVI